MQRGDSTSKPGWFGALAGPDMPALTNSEIGIVAVLLAVPGAFSAIGDWAFGWAMLAVVPGLVASFVLRARAAKTRPRRTALPTAAFVGAGAAAGAGSSLNRYFALYLVVVMLITEHRRRALPIETPEDATQASNRGWSAWFGNSWIGAMLEHRRGQIVAVTLASAFTWVAAMAFTQVAACATPADGGSAHGPQGPITKAFCGTTGATAGDDALIYTLIGLIPVLALAVAVFAVWRLHDRPKRVLAAAGPAIAPASVAIAWVLAGAR